MDRGLEYEPNEHDRQIAMEGASFRIQLKLIAAKLDMSENSLEKYYGNDMRKARFDLHQEMARNMRNIARNQDDKAVSLKATDTILTKMCKIDAPAPEEVDQSALLALKTAIDTMVTAKEKEHDH